MPQAGTIYHLNIGQPDVKTPESFYQAVREFREPTLEYAPASGLPAYIDAVRGYYAKLGVKLEREDILATSGGGEALEFIMACILDDGDELLVPEPFYANYNTFTFMSGGVIHPIPTSADNGYPVRGPEADRIPDQRAHPGNSGHQPRQPHRSGADPRGDAGHRGRGQGA